MAETFKEWVRTAYVPVIMAVSTPEVDAICTKNNLTFVDMMRPHCQVHDINVPVRTVGEQSYRINDLSVRIFSAESMRQPSAEVADEHLRAVIGRHDVAPKAGSTQPRLGEKGEPAPLGSLLRAAQRSPAPWFAEHRRELLRVLAFGDHEAIDHPVACMLVLPSSVQDPVNAFLELAKSPSASPQLMQQGYMSPSMVKHYVLVHDAHTGPADRATEMLQTMRATFGASACHLLLLNTGEAMEAGRYDIWRPHRRDRLRGGGAGEPALAEGEGGPPGEAEGSPVAMHLGDSDVAACRELMSDLVTKQVIPFMENQIRSLNSQVSATRKGLKNQLKNLWWRGGDKKKEGEGEGGGGAQYGAASQEGVIRLLADLAFQLQDYETALSNYRLLAGDYKADRAWRHYAGCMEMAGISLVMGDGSRREAESSLDSAVAAYLRPAEPGAGGGGGGVSPPSASGSPAPSSSVAGGGGVSAGGRRLGTRAALVLADVFRGRGLCREAAGVLVRASMAEESKLHAAILLEQCAAAYLAASPPALRKHAFYLVLAGHRYSEAGQRRHAVRCYVGVLGVYAGRRWGYIEEHLHLELGRQACHIGNLGDAVRHYASLLSCEHQPPAAQATYLEEFLVVMRRWAESVDREKAAGGVVGAGGGGEGAEMTMRERLERELPLPSVNVTRVAVQFDDARSYGSPAARGLPEDTWRACEEGLLPTSASMTWMDGAARQKGEHHSTCVAGEGVRVTVELTNTLQAPIKLSGLRLVCEFTPAEGEGVGEGPAVAEQELSFYPGETTTVALSVTPQSAGVMCVVGLEWTLCGVARGRRDFAARPHPTRRKRGLPPSQQTARVLFRALPRMPRLEASLEGLPSSLLEGEVRRCELVLRNGGPSPLHKVSMRASTPAMLCGTSPGELDGQVPDCLLRAAGGLGAGEAGAALTAPAAGEVFRFPPDVRLAAGAELRWPVWVHPTTSGHLSFHYVLCYEPEEAAPAEMKHRSVRCSHAVQVMPSLRVSVTATPSAGHLRRHLLHLQVDSLLPSGGVVARQIACGAPGRRVEALPPLHSPAGGTTPPSSHSSSLRGEVLAPGGTSSLFVHLVDEEARERGGAEGGASVLTMGGAEEIDCAHPVLRRLLAAQHGGSSKGGGGGGERGAPPAAQGAVLFWEAAAAAAPALPGAVGGGGGAGAKAELPPRLGMHAIPLSATTATTAPSAPSVGAGAEVGVLLRGPPVVEHDFGSGAPCVVSLSAHVANLSGAEVAPRVRAGDGGLGGGARWLPTAAPQGGGAAGAVAAAAASAAAAGGGGVPPSAAPPLSSSAAAAAAAASTGGGGARAGGPEHLGPHVWCGRTRALLPPLAPGAEAKVPLLAAFYQPGKFLVGQYWVSWGASGTEQNVEGPPLLVDVRQSAPAGAAAPALAAPPPQASLI